MVDKISRDNNSYTVRVGLLETLQSHKDRARNKYRVAVLFELCLLLRRLRHRWIQ